jgi:hypothetical protein
MFKSLITGVVMAFVEGARADPVPGWKIPDWDKPADEIKASAAAAGLTLAAPSNEDVGLYGLRNDNIPFVIRVIFYGKPEREFPLFTSNRLEAVRIVLDRPSDCTAVIDGLNRDYGSGTKDPSFANINWPTTSQFGLTVVNNSTFCWPLFSKPGT